MDEHAAEAAHAVAHAGQGLGLMGDIAVVLLLGLVFGLLASRLRLPPLVGFLVAGVMVGPYVPGLVADVHVAEQLGEIGVVLLMFGVGLHFSLRDLAAVRNIAIPGAIGQSILATALTVAVVHAFGWGLGAGIVLGLALSVASTVVLVRALMANKVLATHSGRVAIGWLVVEDLFSAFVLVLLPLLAAVLGGSALAQGQQDSIIKTLLNPTDSALALAVRSAGVPESIPSLLVITLINVGLLAAIVFGIGRKVVPWLLEHINRSGSDELFTLGAVVLALAVAFGTSALFGLSVAMGAFFAGIVVGSSRLSHRIGEDMRPLRDLFGVLFFASVGMLFDPTAPLRMPLQVLAVLLIVLVAKPLAAGLLARAFHQPRETVLVVAPGLAQIGEFSFILATLGRASGLLPEDGYQLVVTAAIVSIALNPLAFHLANTFGAIRPSMVPALPTAAR